MNKRRLKYKPEIRNALIDFQKKSNLELGFIDNETLKALNLKR